MEAMTKDEEIMGPILIYGAIIFVLVFLIFVVPMISAEQAAKKQQELEALVKERQDFIGQDQIVDVVRVVSHSDRGHQWFTAVVEKPSGRQSWRVYGQPPLEKERWKVEVKPDGKVYFVEKIK